MFAQLLKYLPLLIILYAGYGINTLYTEHQEMLESKQGAIPAIQGRINRLERERKEVESFMADIEAAKKRIELVAQEVEALQKKLPANIPDSENIAMFQGITDSLNIKDVSISPGSEENNGFYFKKSYEFSGRGTFLQFLILMEKIADNERLLNVRTVTMNKDDNQARGRYQLIKTQMKIETYRYNSAHKEDRNIPAITPPADGHPVEGEVPPPAQGDSA